MAENAGTDGGMAGSESDTRGGDYGGDGSNPGGGLSIGSPGLGLAAGWGYSGAPGLGLNDGLTDAYGRDVSPGGTGIRGDAGGAGIGDGIGASLTGLAGMDLGLSPSQKAGMLGYLAKADEKDVSMFTKVVDVLLSLGVPVYGLLNTITKGVTGKSLTDTAMGWAKSAGLTPDQLGKVESAIGPGSGAVQGDAGRDNAMTWNSAAGNPGSTTPGTDANTPADPWADLFSEFTGGSKDITYTAPEYNADPTGMIARSGKYADAYEQYIAPYALKMMGEVDRYGSDSYRQQMANEAMAGIQSQSDMGLQSAQRNMARMGVNPASGRMLAMQNQNAIQTAGQKVQAAMNSDKSLRDTYTKGLGAIQTMGADIAKMGQGWGALGADAAKSQNAWNLGTSELGLKAATQNQNNAYNWGNLANQKYGIDKGISAKADAALSDNQWTLGTALVGKLFGGLTTPSTTTPTKNWWETDTEVRL